MPPTVVASPLKFPLSQFPVPAHTSVTPSNVPAGGGSSAGGGGGGGTGGNGEAGSNKRERESSTSSSGGGTPSKRVRVTRKSASGNGEE